MKTFLLLALSLTTALAQVARAEDLDQIKHPNKPAKAPARQPAVIQAPRIQQNATVRQHTPVYRTPQINANTNQNFRTRTFTNQDSVRRLNRDSEFAPRIRTNPRVVTTPPAVTIPQTNTTVQSNVVTPNRFNRENLNRRTDRNWQNRTTTNNFQNQTTPNFDRDDARRRDRHHHDRGWWRSRYSRFVLFGGGYYYWNNNYWYPAYGYDPYYSTYSYDEPIYSYNDQDPGQVIASVQTELQRLGYYRYAVDGLMGPGTRAALANFQRDNGLSITAAIDRRTLQSLGLG
ncbi:MAG: hypothetical protein DLM73_07020 [Chthoniobacterales bacterium]|nr:MAG: hypothetical protein DLM73_07020 [Chthoniobacterales bacterium]